MLLVRLFGTPCLSHEGRPVSISCRKAWPLLAVLAAGGGRPVARSRVAGHLWPELDEKRALRALSTTQWRLGKALLRHGLREQALLQADPFEIALSPGADCDLRDFRALLEGGPGPEALERAAALQAAELLPEEDLPWCNLERESLRALLVAALDRLLAHYESVGDHDGCLRAGQRLVAAEPFLEHAHRALIRAYAATGERAAAARQFSLCRDLLRTELGLDPMPETVTALRLALGHGAAAPIAFERAAPEAPAAAIARLREHLLGAQRALDDLGRS